MEMEKFFHDDGFLPVLFERALNRDISTLTIFYLSCLKRVNYDKFMRLNVSSLFL